MLKLDGHGCSPAVLEKVVTAGGEFGSFARASKMLGVLAEVQVSAMQVSRLTHEVGAELIVQRDAQAEAHRRRELASEAATPVPIACVEVDGGRIRTRAEEQPRGVFDPAWKETKIACLWRMSGERFAQDPHPQPPKVFTDPERVRRMVRELKNTASPHEDRGDPKSNGGLRRRRRRPRSAPRVWPPQRVFRTCVATRRDVHAFGPLVAAEAQRRGFYEAGRQVFLGDGDHKNWTVHQAHFAHFTAVTDFVHVLGYVYEAAGAVTSSLAAQWEQYVAWMTACWQGRASEVLEQLRPWAERLGPPEKKGAEADPRDPRVIVARTITYLENNQSRMRYPEYRRQGLPVTSSLVESLIKQFNQRVKGTEKFWTRPEGVEQILQVKAALLSDDNRLRRHILHRLGRPHRRHQTTPT